MSREEKLYRRLPGRGRSFFGSRRLWLGPDHLLEVEGRGYTETYRRFYYSDIQAIVLRETRRWIAVALFLGMPLTAVLLAFFLSSPQSRWFWAIPAAVLSLAVAIHLLSGRSCVCQIQTIVQTAPLLSLRRRRAAFRAIARIRERVKAVQGDAIPAEISETAATAGAAEPPATIEPVPAVPAAPARVPPALPGRRDNGRVHAMLFGLLLLDAALTAASLAAPSRALDIAGQLLLLVQFGFAIGALVRQRRSDLPIGVRAVVWATLGYLSVTVLIIWVSNWMATIRALSAPAATHPAPGRRLALDAFGLIAPLVLGVAGQILLRHFRRDREEADLTILGPRQDGA
jgi:hypothetical protein